MNGNNIKSRRCRRCNKTKTVNCFVRFGPFKNGSYSYNPFCLECAKAGLARSKECSDTRKALKTARVNNAKDSGFMVCNTCKKKLPISMFSWIDKNTINYKCKDCVVSYCDKRYFLKSKSDRKIDYEMYRSILKDNPKKYELYLLRKRASGETYSYLKGLTNLASVKKNIGCSRNQLIKYIESQFEKGMNWENYGGAGWQIDHVIPLSSFDLSDIEQKKRAMHYSNLQPLWAIENKKKHAKIPKEYQPTLGI